MQQTTSNRWLRQASGWKRFLHEIWKRFLHEIMISWG